MSSLGVDVERRFPGALVRARAELPLDGVAVLFGPSGAGKTTVLRLVAGLAGFLVLIPLLRREGQVLRAWRDGKAMRIMVLGAIAGPFVGVSLLMYAVKVIPAGLAQTFVSLSPVIAIPFSMAS